MWLAGLGGRQCWLQLIGVASDGVEVSVMASLSLSEGTCLWYVDCCGSESLSWSCLSPLAL